jgi:GNAT superfamily N-acetyltransferase
MIKDEDIHYKIFTSPTDDIVALLQQTTYGSKGLRYGHLDVKSRTEDLDQPDFHTLYIGDELAAVAAYCHRDISMEGYALNGIYIRYFSVKEKFQGHGLGKKLTQYIDEHYRASVTKPSLGYAYIETKNAPSLAVSKRFKQLEIGKFKSIYFSRFFPKKSALVETVSEERINELLKENHNKYACYTPQKLNYKKGYRIIKRGGIIVAGIQANKVNWRIKKLPGLMGWLTQNVLHYVPIIGRLCPQDTYSFVGFEGVFVRYGYLDELFTLMQHCLAEHHVNSGVLALDITDPLFTQLDKHPKLGTMSKLQKSHPFSILVNDLNLNENYLRELTKRPKYISVFDIT